MSSSGTWQTLFLGVPATRYSLQTFLWHHAWYKHCHAACDADRDFLQPLPFYARVALLVIMDNSS